MNTTYTIERSAIIAADQEKIWRAITQPEHFSKWFGGDIQFDRLAVGATMTFNVGGQSGIATIAAVEKPKRFAFYWTPELGDPTRTLVTFLLEPVAEGTRVTVTDVGYDALPEKVRRSRFEDNSKGWTIQLVNLAEFLQKTKDV